jgi:hypothetical protein
LSRVFAEHAGGDLLVGFEGEERRQTLDELPALLDEPVELLVADMPFVE